MVSRRVSALLLCVVALPGLAGCGARPAPVAPTQQGLRFLAAGQNHQAVQCFDQALEVDPDDALASYGRGMANHNLEAWAEAAADLTAALDKGHPPALEIYFARARCRERLRDWAGAVADYRAATAAEPEHAIALNNLAWLLACCPDPAVRDAKAALPLAQKACELTANENAGLLDTLAAAHAALGDFAEAVRVGQEALDRARSDDEDLEQELADHLELFKAKQPYRIP